MTRLGGQAKKETEHENWPLPSVPLWITGTAKLSDQPRKKAFEDLVAETRAEWDSTQPVHPSSGETRGTAPGETA